MSSPITFSGFNDIDFNVVLTSLMQQASQPLTRLQAQQTALEAQVTTYGTLASRVLALQNAADALGTPSNLSTFAARSSDSLAVAVSGASATAAGRYDVVVQALARAQVTASSTVADADTTIVAAGGTLTIGGTDIALTGPVTLQELANAINQTPDVGVRAAVIRTSETSYRLTLSSEAAGLANAFTITNSLTSPGLTFGANAVAASDAAILVNSIPVTASSNTFTDVIEGVTLTAFTVDADPVSITVESDESALATKLEDFVRAYNDIASFLNAQRTAAAGGDAASIGRDPLLRQLSGSLRTALVGAHGSGAFEHLAEIGISFTRQGTLELDRTRLSEALADDPDAVRELFAGATGVFPEVTSLLEGYSQATGFIPAVKDRLNDQIQHMNAQIDAMQTRLALQRDALQRQFIEADMAISRLQSQTASLASLGAGLGSF